jgi:hypothetical protein
MSNDVVRVEDIVRTIPETRFEHEYSERILGSLNEDRSNKGVLEADIELIHSIEQSRTNLYEYEGKTHARGAKHGNTGPS